MLNQVKQIMQIKQIEQIRQKFKQNRRFRLFIQISGVSFVVMIAIVAITLSAINNAIRPPDIGTLHTAGILTVEGSSPEAQSSTVIPIKSRSLNPETELELEPDLTKMATLPLVGTEERKPLFFTFLVFGLDETLNVDTIMLAAYDAVERNAYIINIPRDTLIDVPRNHRKLSSAYHVGILRYGDHEGGVARLKYEVQTLIGFKPDFYISIHTEAFIRAVDVVGGVEIYVPFRKYYDDPYQDLHIDIPAGLQVLDGENAYHFIRYRLGNDRRYNITDYQRMENMQTVINAMFQSLLTPATLLKIPEFISIFNDNVDTDLAYGELLWFANQARLIGGIEALEIYTLPIAGTSGPPQWYELPFAPGILELINRTINPFVQDITARNLRIATG
ncbi:MAG: LCP family protein [Defluviitaleaceae bacterium]|nr:LCP family protein [Defluviitaleaceae bacterium]